IPYQVLGARAGALALMIAWSRSPKTRSRSGISAILASSSLSPSVLPPRGPRRAAAFSSRARSFTAARSSSVKPPAVLPVALLAGFCVSFIEVSFPCGYSWLASCGSDRCGLPREPVRVGEGPGVAANDDPVRSAALGRDARVPGERTTPVERQLDGARRGGELDVFTAEAPRHCQAAAGVEPLALGDVRGSQQEHDLVELPGGRAGVLLRRSRDLPDRPVRCSYHAAVAPERLGGRLERRGTGVEGGADEGVDVGRLRHHERHREPAEAVRRCLRGAYAHLGAQTEGGGVEAAGDRRVRHFEGERFDGGHGRSFPGFPESLPKVAVSLL